MQRDHEMDSVTREETDRPDEFLEARLRARADRGALRRLRTAEAATDFSSNDYLGIVRGGLLEQARANEGPRHPIAHGSTGSRLLTGNSAEVEELERRLAAFHGAAAGLIFNSGYDANLALFSSVPASGDLLVYDEWVHASIRDGIRLGRATSLPFRHNDMRHLEARLTGAAGIGARAARLRARVFVAIESIYSMDGDRAPLGEIAALCARHDAHLIVDEAHATGVSGNRGRGLVDEDGIADQTFVRLHTFGKALGCHGALVLGSETLRDYLINFAHSFIYTTALPPESLRAIAASYRLFPELDVERTRLHSLIAHFRRHRDRLDPRRFVGGVTQIQGILVPGNERVRALSEALLAESIDARPILSPTVRRGTERLRICLHAFNTEAEIDRLFRVVERCL